MKIFIMHNCVARIVYTNKIMTRKGSWCLYSDNKKADNKKRYVVSLIVPNPEFGFRSRDQLFA